MVKCFWIWWDRAEENNQASQGDPISHFSTEAVPPMAGCVFNTAESQDSPELCLVLKGHHLVVLLDLTFAFCFANKVHGNMDHVLGT